MCGRYVLFTDEEEDEIVELVHEIQRRMDQENDGSASPRALRARGEVFPTQWAPVLTVDGPAAMCWGLPAFKGSGVIINARAESVFEKGLFRQAMRCRRLVIPSHGFFEWRKQSGTRDKEKLLFNRPGERRLYMAGLFNLYGDEARFAILTTAANEAMKPIHHRMPVILSPSEIAAYLADEDAARALIARVPSALEMAAV